MNLKAKLVKSSLFLEAFASSISMLFDSESGFKKWILVVSAGKDGKTVLTNSTKRLLISAPPAILIIHLKRFIADFSRLRKMNKLVTFPMKLDLAPFCSVKCRVRRTLSCNWGSIFFLFGVRLALVGLIAFFLASIPLDWGRTRELTCAAQP